MEPESDALQTEHPFLIIHHSKPTEIRRPNDPPGLDKGRMEYDVFLGN